MSPIVTSLDAEKEWNKFVDLMREVSLEFSEEELKPLIDDLTAVSMEYQQIPRKMSA